MGRHKKEKPVEEVVINRNDLCVVFTPGTGFGGNKIPLIPVKPDLDNIPEWIENCQKAGEKLGITYAQEAMNYMARQTWKNEDLVKAKEIIAQVFEGQM